MLLVIAGNIHAAPIISGSTGDWNNPSTWIGGIVPGAGDIVTIANGHVVTVTANASCASLIIGNGPLDQNSTLSVTTGVSLAISGNVTIVPPLSGTVDNTLDVNAGTVSCSSVITANSISNTLHSIVSIGTGTLTCSGSFIMGNNTSRSKLIFSGNGLLQIAGNSNALADAQFTAATGTIEYNGSIGQSVLPLSYYTLKCSGNTVKTLTANTVLAGDLVIAASALLDVNNTNNYSLTVGGNWTVTSNSSNPFIERKGTVTFNGTAGVQILTTPLAQETFYNLVINNTAGNTGADIQFNKTCLVAQEYTHTSGNLDLKGNRLLIISANRQGIFTTCNLSGGSIISSVSGSQISFTDSYDSTFVNFTGTKVGDNNIPVSLTINTGRINLENLTLYGTGTFTKRHVYDDIIAKGGNKFYNNISFTLNAAAGSWYFGSGNGALADSFFAKVNVSSFAANSNAKLILGANSTGNYYADDVAFYIRSAGSICIGNSSGASSGTGSSHYFNKAVDTWLTNTGNIIFAEGQSLFPSAVTFNNIVRPGSAAGATGSVYIGRNNSGSSVLFTSAAQLTSGYLYGTTPIYLYNITQNGSLVQSLTNTVSQLSSVIVGDINGPCRWNGPVSFQASILDLAYSTFNGSSNSFILRNSTTPQNCTGGNTFGTSTSNAFNNNGTANWYLSTIAADDYNGDVNYRANSTGAIYPAYNSNCTFATNISIFHSSDSVSFAAGPNGRVTLDGTVSGMFINSSTKTVSFKRITMNKTSGVFTLYSNLSIPVGGNLTLISGRLVTATNAMPILQDENCTVTLNTAASTSYVEGPMRIDVSSTAPQTLHFPIGSGPESRPIDLTIQHTSNTAYSYTAEMVRSGANALGWTNPASVYTTSTFRWWDITRTVTSSGAAAPATELVTSPLPVVSFYYGLNDRAANPVNLTICKNTYNALTTWIDIGATGATNTIGKVTSTSTPSSFSSFSRFTLGYYGIPPAPIGHDSSRCGTGTAVIRATPVYGEYIDWYAAPAGGTALATNTMLFTTPVISSNTTYYAQARNTMGYVSATRTPVTVTITNSPTISSFSPTTGEMGTTVIITGSSFNNNVSSVTFGGVAASSFTVNSSTQITAVVGTGASGSVVVTNDCGPGTRAGFIYNPLTVWTGAINTSWANAGNWDDGVPTSIHSAIIPVVPNQPVVTSNQSVKSITIQTGAVVDIVVGNSLSVRDSLTNNGDVTGGGGIVLSGTASQPIRGTGNYTNLTLSNSNGAIIAPGTGNTVSITGRYIPTTGTLTTNNNLILKSTSSANGIIAAGPAGGGYITGKVVLERYIPAKRAWRLINFPITSSAAPDINTALQEGVGGTASSNPNPGYGTHITGGSIANGFDQNPSGNPSMKEWIGGAWQGITSTNATINNQFPYFVFVRGSRANNLDAGASATADNTTLRVTANIKQGNQGLSITGTGWQLAGNPFPSIINLDAVASGNSTRINRNFIFWDPKLGGSNNVGGFVTASYNGAGYDFSPVPVSPLSEYAQPFAGFYVDAVSTGTVTILETNKCNCGNGNVFRPMPPAATTSKLRVNLHAINADGTNPVVDGAMVSFDDRYSNDKDSYDAGKLPNTLAENIAITKDDNKLSIERRKAVADADTVYLNISNMRVKNYELELTPENFDTTILAFLEDSYTAERKPLSLTAGGTFNFSIINNPAAYAPGRFRIVFEKDRIPVVVRKTFTEHAPAAKQSRITLLQNPVINNTLQLQMFSQQKGNYTVTITDNEGKETAKKQFTHDGMNGLKTIVMKQYLPKGSLIAIIKDPSGNTTSFTIITQ